MFGGLTPFITDFHFDVRCLDQRDIFDQQANHPFAVLIISARRAPKLWKVGNQLMDAFCLFLGDGQAILFTLVFIVCFGLVICSDAVVPLRFQFIGD